MRCVWGFLVDEDFGFVRGGLGEWIGRMDWENGLD